MPSKSKANDRTIETAPVDKQDKLKTKKIISIIGHGYVGKIVELFFQSGLK